MLSKNMTGENMADMIVQMSMRLPDSLRNDLKIQAITNNEKINDLLVRYMREGLERDQSKAE